MFSIHILLRAVLLWMYVRINLRFILPVDIKPATVVDIRNHVDGLVQHCCNYSALAMEVLRSCTKPSMCPVPDVCNILCWRYIP